MKNKLHYSPLALRDLDEIWGYIAANECSLDTANDIVEEILNKVELLENFPKMGKRLDKESYLGGEYRFLAVGTYLIFYRIEINAIYVDRILHKRRDNINIIFSNKNDVE